MRTMADRRGVSRHIRVPESGNLQFSDMSRHMSLGSTCASAQLSIPTDEIRPAAARSLFLRIFDMLKGERREGCCGLSGAFGPWQGDWLRFSNPESRSIHHATLPCTRTILPDFPPTAAMTCLEQMGNILLNGRWTVWTMSAAHCPIPYLPTCGSLVHHASWQQYKSPHTSRDCMPG
jgi:hypothetical protein